MQPNVIHFENYRTSEAININYLILKDLENDVPPNLSKQKQNVQCFIKQKIQRYTNSLMIGLMTIM